YRRPSRPRKRNRRHPDASRTSSSFSATSTWLVETGHETDGRAAPQLINQAAQCFRMAELLDVIVLVNALRERDAGIDNDQHIFMFACGIEDMTGDFGDVKPTVNEIDRDFAFVEPHLLHQHDPPHPNVVRILTRKIKDAAPRNFRTVQ